MSAIASARTPCTTSPLPKSTATTPPSAASAKTETIDRKMIKAVKGTRDILPPSSAVWNRVEAAAREVFRRYNYGEIRTPILEETALFARDGRSLTLRPEATASVMRSYIENRLDQRSGLQKLYYIGPMFRRERPQKGRYRQFYQIGAEAIGSESPAVDAEVIDRKST